MHVNYSFHFHIKPFPWYSNNKKGSKKLDLIINKKQPPATIFWDLSNAKYGSRPEPVSGFYVAVVIDHEIILLLGDEAYTSAAAAQIKSPSLINNNYNKMMMILRREHVYGTKLYSTKADIGGHERNISIDCRISDDDPRLFFSIDDKVALRVKHLKWKFRGNESIEIEGTCVQVSWDVYNWLFHQQDHAGSSNCYALFMFTIFNHEHQDDYELFHHQQQHHLFGLELEEKKMKKNKVGGLLRRSSERSSSSSSLSSAHSSSSCSSSIMEWACGTDQEDQLTNLPFSGFSLLVYAWN